MLRKLLSRMQMQGVPTSTRNKDLCQLIPDEVTIARYGIRTPGVEC